MECRVSRPKQLQGAWTGRISKYIILEPVSLESVEVCRPFYHVLGLQQGGLLDTIQTGSFYKEARLHLKHSFYAFSVCFSVFLRSPST